MCRVLAAIFILRLWFLMKFNRMINYTRVGLERQLFNLAKAK